MAKFYLRDIDDRVWSRAMVRAQVEGWPLRDLLVAFVTSGKAATVRLLVLAALLFPPVFVAAQKPQASHVLIPNLAKPSDLDFEGGACDRTRDTMVCTFQQVLLRHATGSDTCEIFHKSL
jgi:hypothetical protein